MMRRHATIVLAFALVACSNKKDIEHARHSAYDAEFATVFQAALQATRELYSNTEDFPGTGSIKTAWHQVQYASTQDDLSNPRTVQSSQMGGAAAMSPAAAAGGMPTRLAYKRYFIRFDVSVAGGRPWRVKVVGHAAEWDPGNAMPTELHGLARPPWLDGRTEALQVAIYKRLKPAAVPMKDEVEAPKEEAMPKTDPAVFKGVPPAAGKLLAALKDGIAHRDTQTLRQLLADDVVWSLGGSPGADTAMAMWQADPDTLDTMVRVISNGCAGDDKRVACPPGPPRPGAFQLVIEPRGAAWKVTSFVQAE